MSGYTRKDRSGEDGFRGKGARHSENATPRATPEGGHHSADVKAALDGVAAGKSHKGKRVIQANTRPSGIGRGASEGKSWGGEYKNSANSGGTRPGKGAYGYNGEESRGRHHGWAGNEAPAHPEAHAGVPGLSKHNYNTQMPANRSAHVFRGTSKSGLFRVSGHKRAHRIGKG